MSSLSTKTTDESVAVQAHTRQGSLKLFWIGNDIEKDVRNDYSIPVENKLLVVGWDHVSNTNRAFFFEPTAQYSTEEHLGFEFGAGTSLYGSCTFKFKGLRMVAGGYNTINQISAIFPNRMERVSSLPFPLLGATCTYDRSTVYLCFPDDNDRACWTTTDLLTYRKINDAIYSHKDYSYESERVIIFDEKLTAVSKGGIVEQYIGHNDTWEGGEIPTVSMFGDVEGYSLFVMGDVDDTEVLYINGKNDVSMSCLWV